MAFLSEIYKDTNFRMLKKILKGCNYRAGPSKQDVSDEQLATFDLLP